ncbi:Excinuclease ABC subunit C [Humidesulfovibrio mexicanus]|uniref:UvrABC system protein C n=1 Tax=Humidesulfovibrio mexicanus TaxID=147047 RepID=A0A238Z6W1_9BACT|nr:excinuclease ABC subunit UvrC [Humidesulfovibrio mexicanus]SNR78641.1 Excinuclease ABC subunit C [Humidesulfovibrio mexicanus]
MEFIAKDYPDSPGVYLMKDDSGRIIYVGKAVSLRKRLSSYFRAGADHSPKTRALVARIARVDFLLVSTEKEALLLEESLIKKHRPRYNIVLRDDKRSLLFRLDKAAAFPRLTMTRHVVRDGSAYFGPYASASAARATQKLVGGIFRLRKCSDTVFKNRVRPCLYFQLDQCLAPCVLPVDRDEYMALVRQVEQFLSGRSQSLVRDLRRRMDKAAGDMRYEDAARLRDQIRAIEATLESQASVLRDALDRDVVAVAQLAEEGLGVGLLFVRGGKLLEQKTFHWSGLGASEAADALESFLAQFYGAQRYIPGRVVLSHPPETTSLAEVLAERRGGPCRVSAPRGDDERRLLDLALNLARTAHRTDGVQDVASVLEQALGLPGPPLRVECVDISHLGGSGVRAGVVVFENGEERKEDFRTYALPGVEGSGDDYAALAQWAERRAQSGPPWPDLLLIDGGRGQLAAVTAALAQALPDTPLECASIAKGPSRRAGELEDRVFRPGRRNPVALKPGSPALLFLQRVRDAAHRFVIGRGRAATRRRSLSGELLALPGVGPKTARHLFDHFGSVKAIRAASVEALAAVPGLGPAKAARLRQAFDGAQAETSRQES